MLDLGELEARQARYHDRWLSGTPLSRIPNSERMPAHATAKEREILASIALLRFATVKQLMALTGRKQRRVHETMEVLRSKQLVAWFRWVDTRQAGAGMDPLPTTFVYCLTTKGVERCILDRVMEDDRYTLTRNWKGKAVLHSTMPHQLGITDICLGFAMASRRSPTYEIVRTVPDFVYEEIENKYRIATIELLGTKNETRADLIACARAKNSGNLFTLYVELERRNKGAAEIKKKFQNYSVLFLSKNRRFNDGPPVLLYVVTPCVDPRDTESRMGLVRKWVSETPVAPAFRITSLDRLMDNAFGDVWQKADGTRWSIQR